MKKLLLLEWMKIKSYKTFWIFIGLYIFLNIVWNFGISYGMLKFSDGGINPIDASYDFPGVWAKVSYTASWMMVILCLLVITLVSNEFQFKTNRQNVIDGLSRSDFLNGKIGLIFILSLGTVVLTYLIGLLLGFANGGGNPLLKLRPLFYQFIYAFNYLFFALLITMFIKKSGLSIALFFCYFLFIEGGVRYLINYKFSPVGNFFPLQASDELLPLPLNSSISKMAGLDQEPLNPVFYLLASILYIALYYFIAKRNIEKADL
jgi:ABC-2 type transport system permease protein